MSHNHFGAGEKVSSGAVIVVSEFFLSLLYLYWQHIPRYEIAGDFESMLWVNFVTSFPFSFLSVDKHKQQFVI